ncbi:thaumatin-like protein [Auriculariales sp. MPI-PUGE-AT-0066]|nr:thaumatin-like protein [Auriculariales sp. MPI-PUGE-AT-0066]
MKSFAVALAVAPVALARTFTFYNGCPFTIWPAIFTDLNRNAAPPAGVPTGWEAAAYTARTYTIPNNWKSARVWGRRNCNFTSSLPDYAQCLTGGCVGGLQCDINRGTGVPPVSLAEFNLDDNGSDWYDISFVDGYNLPISISNNKGCPSPGCRVDLGPNCPSPLKGPFDSSGFPVGCRSACSANLDGNPGNSKNCCSGQYGTPQTCPASGVQYYSYFKNACPNAYAYAYDEGSESALWTCPSSKLADYTITWCPP